LQINHSEAEEKQFQLSETEGRVLELPGASCRFIKKTHRPSENEFSLGKGAKKLMEQSIISAGFRAIIGSGLKAKG
jgi:hypothetical protein